MSDAPRTRLFLDQPLAAGVSIALPEGPAHKLRAVLRAVPGQTVALFNGGDGEWAARLDAVGKRTVSVTVESRLRPPVPADAIPGPGPWLCFAPLKKDALDILVEKATELGVAGLQPVLTDRTQGSRLNLERLTATATAAAEQCERLDVPEIRAPVPLARLLADWPAGRVLLACLERPGPHGSPAPIATVASAIGAVPATVLCGPEGGFSVSELDALTNAAFVRAVGLGPRILRAETAALSALAIWQAVAGDGAAPPPARAIAPPADPVSLPPTRSGTEGKCA